MLPECLRYRQSVEPHLCGSIRASERVRCNLGRRKIHDRKIRDEELSLQKQNSGVLMQPPPILRGYTAAVPKPLPDRKKGHTKEG